MAPRPDTLSHIDTDTLEMITDTDSEDEVGQMKHRRSLVMMEQNLLEPCDQSPILPERLSRQEQSFTDGASLERLLLERLLLRKELRLRSMQERLLEQEHDLEKLTSRLAELESLPGYRLFLAVSRQLGQAAAAGERGVNLAKLGFTWLLSTLYQVVFVYLLDLVPSSLSLGAAALVQRTGNVLAQRAENFSNECVENMEWNTEKEKSRSREERRRRRRS